MLVHLILHVILLYALMAIPTDNSESDKEEVIMHHVWSSCNLTIIDVAM